MAIQSRPITSRVGSELLDSKRSSFYQTIFSLLRQHEESVRPGELGPFRNELIRFRANTSLGFPESDIESLQENGCELSSFPDFTITVNNIGLYGPASPLPAHYSEMLLDEVENHNSPRHFLDLFNHRIVGFLYRVWDKYQYANHYRENLSDSQSRQLLSLFGLGHLEVNSNSDIDYYRLLPFAKTLSGNRRSACTIEKVLATYFSTPFRIESFVPEIIPLEEGQQTSIGKTGCRLGDEAIVGKTVLSTSTKYRVHIGPVEYDAYLKFMPGNVWYKALRQLLNTLVLDSLEYDVWIRIRREGVESCHLSGVSSACLGRTSWVGNSSEGCLTIKQRGNY